MVSECISPSQTAVSDARRLASASNVAVVLPAGAGKTELIARATCFASETAMTPTYPHPYPRWG